MRANKMQKNNEEIKSNGIKNKVNDNLGLKSRLKNIEGNVNIKKDDVLESRINKNEQILNKLARKNEALFDNT